MKKIVVAALVLAGVGAVALGATRLANGCCPLTGKPICVRTGEPLSRQAQPAASPMSDFSVQIAPGVAAAEQTTIGATSGRACCASKRHCCAAKAAVEESPKCEAKAEAPAVPALQQ